MGNMQFLLLNYKGCYAEYVFSPAAHNDHLIPVEIGLFGFPSHHRIHGTHDAHLKESQHDSI